MVGVLAADLTHASGIRAQEDGTAAPVSHRCYLLTDQRTEMKSEAYCARRGTGAKTVKQSSYYKSEALKGTVR